MDQNSLTLPHLAEKDSLAGKYLSMQENLRTLYPKNSSMVYINNNFREFSDSPVVRTGLLLLRAGIQSLIGKLRSPQVKKKNDDNSNNSHD